MYWNAQPLRNIAHLNYSMAKYCNEAISKNCHHDCRNHHHKSRVCHLDRHDQHLQRHDLNDMTSARSM